MPWSYVSLDQMKRRLQDDDPSITIDDAIYRSVLEGVSRQVDQITGRRFQPHTATRSFTARSTSRLRVPDLLTVTTLKTDNNHDGTYERTWDTNDYELLPYNAPDDEMPYTSIETTRTGLGNESFPTVPKGVEIAGVWGYWLDTLSGGTLGAAISDTTSLEFTMASGHTVEVLNTVLIGSEQGYVTAVGPTSITVESRGANGTTAATHLTGATVSVYRYPAPVVEATAIQAARIFRRKDAPFGIAGSDELGTSRVIPRLDPDVKLLLSAYRRLSLGVA